MRGDLKAYQGVQVRSWPDSQGIVHTAIYRPRGMPQDDYTAHLEDIYDALLRYRGELERIHQVDREPLNSDVFAVLDIGSDPGGTWGPGMMYQGEVTVELEDLTEAAVFAVRFELMS